MSSQVFAYTKSLEFKTLLEIEIKTMTGFAPVIKESLEDFQSMLGLFPAIEVLVIEEPAEKQDYKFLLDSLTSREESIKNILVLSKGTGVPLKSSTSFASENVKGLIDHLKGLLKPAAVSEGYISVPIDSLVHFKIVPFDLYIKVGEKYVKRIHANEDIDEDIAGALKQKGVTDFYFERQFNKDFSLMLLNNMINKVEKDDYASVDAKLKAKSEVFQTTKAIVQSVGLPPRVIQVCESVMDSIADEVTKSKDRLSTFLNGLKASSDASFQFRFIELTSFIATQLVDQMKEGTPEKIKTVVFSAFFCDISLKDSAQLELRTNDAIKDLWPEDKKLISEHALKSSEIVAKYKNAPAEAAAIVKQHHGSLEGVGLPSVPAAGLHPLSLVLMAAQELALAILKTPEAPVHEVVGKVVNQFGGSGIHPHLAAFEKSCKASS